MKVVIQRVREASVTVEGRTVGRIGRGYLVLVGFTAGDDAGVIDWMAGKINGLRVFEDGEGRMNQSVADVGGSVLVVSQFTLYADVSRGRRPSFIRAAPPETAVLLYERFIEALRAEELTVASGEFGAAMDVSLVNDGPVTLVLER